MAPPIPVSAPITPLRPTRQQVAQLIVEGLTAQRIATTAGLSPHTVRKYTREIRQSVHCPPRCKLHHFVHLLLATRQVIPPATDRTAPHLTAQEQRLLTAVAAHSATGDIARAAKIAPADVRSALDTLLRRTHAADLTRLVVLAHTWGLLGTAPATTAQNGSGR